MTPTVTNELVVSCLGAWVNGLSAYPGSPFVLETSVNSSSTSTTIWCVDLIQTSIVSENPTWTSTSGGPYAIAVVTFKP